MLCINFYRENMKKIFLSETIRPRALILGMKHHPSLFNLCPWVQKWAHLGGHIFYIGLYRENMKRSSCLKPQGLEP